MKTKTAKRAGKSIFTALVFIVPLATLACEFCNKQLYEDLKNGARGKTLAGRELLASINAQSGLQSLLAYAASATAAQPAQPKSEDRDFIEIIKRDSRLPIPATSYVPQNAKPDKSFTIELQEGDAYIGQGVMFKGFTTNGKIPGPTFTMAEGDIIELVIVNKGTIPHGASIHAAYTQTSKYVGKIAPGETRKFLFRVTYPGIYMYHCAPGGHAIPIHILYGQYGMMVVEPKKKYKLEQLLGKKPDVEINLLQHEYYSNGKDAIDGHPMYTAFNGKMFRYVEEPIKAKPGDYVRINYLNIGPNQSATFHIVGIIWDYAYWQGHPENLFVGGQSVIAGPTDSWVVEFRMPPDEGVFLLLSHAVGATARGAIALLIGDRNAKTPVKIEADGPAYSDSEMNEFRAKATRTISPFAPGSADVDVPYTPAIGQKEVIVKIIGNSFNPKVLDIPSGTTVKWINEEAFTYLEGEFSGTHNVVGIKGPEPFSSALLGHAESFSHTFTKAGEHEYMCTPHPYMRGMIKVRHATTAGTGSTWALAMAVLALGGVVVLFLRRQYAGAR
jgi:nitrite reductase (NO-forming)